MEPQVMTAREAAEFLRVDYKTVRKWAKAKRIPCRMVGSSKHVTFLFSRPALMEWLEGGKRKAS